MSFLKAIILVAGYATRLYPLTLDKSKALLPINGIPIITYITKELNKIEEIDNIFVVSNSKFADDFYKWHAEVKNISRIPIEVIDNGTSSKEERRGAIGDIHYTVEQKGIVNEDIIVIAGDNYFTYDLKDYYNFYKQVNKDCVCVKEVNNINILRQFAVAVIDENNKIIDLEEKPQNPKSNIGAYASYIYKKETVELIKKYLDEGNNPDSPGYFVQWLYKLKDVMAYKMKGECYDIGTFESYEEVQNLFKVNSD